MAWNPFRKAPKKPNSDLVADSDFDSQVQLFADIEVTTKKVYKDAKRYVEDNSNVSKCQQRIFQDLSVTASNISRSDELKKVVDHLQYTMLKHAELSVELNANIKRTFIDPLKKFNLNFTTVNNAIKRREQSLQDYARYLNRREKFMEKGSQSMQSGKFDANERYLSLARADFERRNRMLLEELPKFYECRTTYFEPCFQALVRSQLQYYKSSRDLFEDFSIGFPAQDDKSEQYVNEMNSRLADIKALSIVAGK